MKRATRLIVVMLLLLCLTGCSWAQLLGELDSKKTKEQPISTSIQNSINGMEDTYKRITNKKITTEERIESVEEYVEKLARLMHSEESVELSDKLLCKILKKRVAALTKTETFETKKLKARMVSYHAPTDLFEEAARNWIILQWQWDGEKPQTQVIVNSGAAAPEEFDLVNESGAPALVLAEYAKSDLPYARRVTTWQLGSDGWANTKMAAD